MTVRLLCTTSALVLVSYGGSAQEMSFNRIASFAVPQNMGAGEHRARETSSEIVAATGDGQTLVYTDRPLGVIGFIDIADPAALPPARQCRDGGRADLGRHRREYGLRRREHLRKVY